MFNRLFASKKRPCFKQTSQWDTLNLDLSGCRFSINLPPQDYEFPEEKRGTQFNIFDNDLYDYDEKPDRNGYPPSFEGVSVPGVLKRNWYTYGAIWRARNLGTLQCSTVICDTSRMKPNLNCFNPEQLERLLLHGLYQTCGPGGGKNEYVAPVDWQIKTVGGVDWAYYESWSQKPEWVEGETSTNYDTSFIVWLAAPLFKDKYLLVSFSSSGGGWGRLAQPNNELMFSRIQAIISGLRLQLSPESLKQQAEARQQYPNAHYSPVRQPENWRYYGSYRDGDFLADEKPLVFEGDCSPPPKLF